MTELLIKCECGATTEITEVELLELESVECQSCGTDNYVDAVNKNAMKETGERKELNFD